MEITGANIKQLAPWIDPARGAILGQALTENLGDINTPLRVRHFVAQVATETWGFRKLVESMFYSDPVHLMNVFPREIHSISDARELIQEGQEAIANRVYASRLGNGDETSGDGWKYRGRGFIQLTGKYNYKQVGKQIAMDLVNKPEILELPDLAAEAAVRFWDFHSCNVYADDDDVEAVTARINPSLQGLDDRRNWLMKASKIWV
ncbi:COG3179 Predicted chitinase [uncultured Caudovirales phage]|uniref:COG3179 Predicted chitinase n=1 Tax=uncultured Caudovirales phage TaxID=2100421 RepID=A0A6J5KKQ2_9CAUD|nr:COG3179 Predicted chitinase [uncultured Caudovirales phage]